MRKSKRSIAITAAGIIVLGVLISVVRVDFWSLRQPFRRDHNNLRLISPELSVVGETRINSNYGKTPLSFEANLGQTNSQVKFLSRGRGYTLFLSSNEVVMSFIRHQPTPTQNGLDIIVERTKTETTVMRMKLVGANSSPEVQGMGELPGKANYFIGNDPSRWRTDVPTFRKVNYEDVYPGIDLVYYGNEGSLEYDFIVAPGADPNAITLEFSGAQKFEIDDKGDLVLHIPGGEIRQQKPTVYQEIGGFRQKIDGSFVFHETANSQSELQDPKLAVENWSVGIELGDYDSDLPLVIDPVYIFSTFLGGTGTDRARDVAVDAAGNVYVAGNTNSPFFPDNNYPQPLGSAGQDIFVTRLNSEGSMVVYSTYIGGNGDEIVRSIAVDNVGKVYLTGETNSTGFPPVNAFQPIYGEGSQDAFVSVLNSSGVLIYSTYLGGDKGDAGADIVVDGLQDVYVVGSTGSDDLSTPGVFQGSRNSSGDLFGFGDVFVTKLKTDGSDPIYFTYLGGTIGQTGFGIAVDEVSKNVYVTGSTISTNFPIENPYQPDNNGGSIDGTLGDAFVTVLKADFTDLIFSTYLGGTGGDVASSIAIDGARNIYVTGTTTSTNLFPIKNAKYPTYNVGGTFGFDAFVTVLHEDSTDFIFSTFLGGEKDDIAHRIVVDEFQTFFVTGITRSSSFPVVNAIQPDYGGATSEALFFLRGDAFITRLDTSGSPLLYSSYLGGEIYDESHGMALDGSGNVYLAGGTESTETTDPKFPLKNALYGTHSGDLVSGFVDAFVTRIDLEDFDGDHIPKSLDGDDTVPSNDFSDGDGSFGEIITRGNHTLIFTIEPVGIKVFADPSGGALPAKIFQCGLAEIESLDAGDEILVDCGSVTIKVINGIVKITFFNVDNTVATASLGAGNTLKFEQETFTITAPPSNPEPVIILVQEQEVQVNPGETISTLEVPPLPHSFLFLADKKIKVDGLLSSDGDMHSNDKIDFHKGNPSTHTGNLTAVGKVKIDKDHTIAGNVTAGGKIDLKGNAVVTGTVTENALVAVEPLPALSFSAGGVKVTVKKNQSQSLTPGSYGKVKVDRGGTLVLSSGEYFFEVLDLKDNTTLSIDVSTGPVTVNTVKKLHFHKNSEVDINSPVGSASRFVTFNSLKKVDIHQGAKVLGSIFAPDDKVHLHKNVSFQGAICAKDIDVDKGSILLHHNSSGTLPKIIAPILAVDIEEDVEEQDLNSVPTEFELSQNYPNPFNPSTTILFSVPEASEVTLAIYNLNGQLVQTLFSGTIKAGRHSVVWNGKDLRGSSVASGIYLYRITAGGFSQVKKMSLMR